MIGKIGGRIANLKYIISLKKYRKNGKITEKMTYFIRTIFGIAEIESVLFLFSKKNREICSSHGKKLSQSLD